MLLSGGGREMKIPGKNVRVSVSLSLDRKDLSGQSSDSSFANEGAKPQRIMVTTQIPTAEPADLMRLVELARACDSLDEPIIYNVADELCAAMSIRQVIFSGDLQAVRADDLQVYNISFELQEYQSVSQKREERTNANSAAGSVSTDGVVQVGSVDPVKVNQIAKATQK